jgi:hypothetical protein
MNDAESLVSYVFQFQEGSVYKMGDLEFRGLDGKPRTACWRHGGCWRSENSQFGLPRQFTESLSAQYPADQWKITVHETPEDQDKTVDVSLPFDPRR